MNHARTWDRLIFAGDVLDIGDEPQLCLDILTGAGAEMLWGNHEASVMYRRPVRPQSQESWRFYDLIKSKLNDWKVADAVEGVLITHAGLSRKWMTLRSRDAGDIAAWINEKFSADCSRDMFWDECSPLWFRPRWDSHLYARDAEPAPGIVQIAGHTPPQWLDTFDGFHVVDPYIDGMDETRYRYAIIEDGKVTVYDSKEAE
jgi:hypothetical protein